MELIDQYDEMELEKRGLGFKNMSHCILISKLLYLWRPGQCGQIYAGHLGEQNISRGCVPDMFLCFFRKKKKKKFHHYGHGLGSLGSILSSGKGTRSSWPCIIVRHCKLKIIWVMKMLHKFLSAYENLMLILTEGLQDLEFQVAKVLLKAVYYYFLYSGGYVILVNLVPH